MHGFREAIHGLAEATFGLSEAHHGIREPKLRRRAINRRPPKRNHGRAETSLCPLAWKNTLQKAKLSLMRSKSGLERRFA